jgi:signal transduction histidine kinase
VVPSWSRRIARPFELVEHAEGELGLMPALAGATSGNAGPFADPETAREDASHTAELFRLGVEIALGLAEPGSPPEVTQRLLERAVIALRADRLSLAIVQGEEALIQESYADAGTESPAARLQPLLVLPLVARTIQGGEPLVLSRGHPDFREPDAGADGQHVMSVPLVLGGEVIAVLGASRVEDRPFTSVDLATLRQVGSVAALAIQNARLWSELQEARARSKQAAERLQVGLDVAIDLAQTVDPKQVVVGLLRRATEAARADRATLARVEDGEVLIEAACDHRGQVLAAGSRFRASEQPVVREALRSRLITQGDTANLQLLPPALRRRLGAIGRVLVVPLLAGGELSGLLTLLRRRPQEFDEDDVAKVQQVATVAGLALRNARLFEEARQASDAKTSFMNLAAHELRTPISVIKGYLSMLLDASFGPGPESWKQPLEILGAKSEELGQMVETILVAARLQAGNGTRRRPADLVETTRAALARVQPRAALLGAKLIEELDDERLLVAIEAQDLARILDSLFDNALTYSRGRPWMRVRVGAEAESAWVVVEDRGRGIPGAARHQIFEQFSRVDDASFGYPSGAGLGLYIARALAERPGGTLELERSRVGRGSSFRLTLPRVDAG